MISNNATINNTTGNTQETTEDILLINGDVDSTERKVSCSYNLLVAVNTNNSIIKEEMPSVSRFRFIRSKDVVIVALFPNQKPLIPGVKDFHPGRIAWELHLRGRREDYI
jgi:hypothetical protein